MYGVPMNGVEWAKYAQFALGVAGLVYPHLNPLKHLFLGNTQVTALAKDSEFIEYLTGRWARRALNGGDPDMATDQRASFPVRVVTGNDDWVVKESSARGLYGEIDWINVDQDHRKLVKPVESFIILVFDRSRFYSGKSRTWMAPALLLKLRMVKLTEFGHCASKRRFRTGYSNWSSKILQRIRLRRPPHKRTWDSD